MPELPEVETTKNGIAPLINQKIKCIKVRESRLRWPVPQEIKAIKNELILSINRRGKYILIELQSGFIVIHLGMSGSMRLLSQAQAPQKHDHIDLILANGTILRYTDPRRFGAWLFTTDLTTLPQLAILGIEPLSRKFTADYLFEAFKNRKTPIKNAIMNSHIVVGVGNIYACESLFKAKISPFKPAKTLSKNELNHLISAIQSILTKAIAQGGTTLKDFAQTDGKPGYFAQQLMVYGRAQKPCFVCQTRIEAQTIGQRNTFYCPTCQQEALKSNAR